MSVFSLVGIGTNDIVPTLSRIVFNTGATSASSIFAAAQDGIPEVGDLQKHNVKQKYWTLIEHAEFVDSWLSHSNQQ